jgi:hypothetical protein
MTSLQKRLGMCAALFALIAAGTQAHAQVNSNSSLYLNADVNATTGTSILQRSSTSTTAGSATPNANVNAQVNANVNSRINNSATTGTGTASTSTDTEDDTIVFTRSDVKNNSGVVINPADVTTSAEFSTYAKSIIANDENVTKIESNSEEVSIWYKEPAKFLGIVPIMVNTQATVKADGTVDIDYPWWYGLFVTGGGNESLETNVNSTAGTIAKSEASAEFSSATQARLLNALRSTMKMHYEANVAVGTSTDASTY